MKHQARSVLQTPIPALLKLATAALLLSTACGELSMS